ncbi:MAG: ATP-binding cassette domain-containing protein [Candidatus Rokubacteria bacterium]|nr:ATP-binding cassette domain-containing protein [Candidatus Rokubacteria bacterium]
MALTVDRVGVQFGGLRALEDVEISVEAGRIVGLVGPNGAGKTTLFNSITGILRPQDGRVFIDGEDISDLRPDQRVRLGIGRTFQTPRLDLDASALDAVLVGFYPTIRQGFVGAFLGLPEVRQQEARIRTQARHLIEEFELVADPHVRAGELSLARLRLLEVARALAGNPKYLLLDEPAAGLDDHDRLLLAAAIRAAAKRGIGVLLVEHNVPFVADLGEELIALVNGRVIASGRPSVVVADERVIAAYLGAHSVA